VANHLSQDLLNHRQFNGVSTTTVYWMVELNHCKNQMFIKYLEWSVNSNVLTRKVNALWNVSNVEKLAADLHAKLLPWASWDIFQRSSYHTWPLRLKIDGKIISGSPISVGLPNIKKCQIEAISNHSWCWTSGPNIVKIRLLAIFYFSTNHDKHNERMYHTTNKLMWSQ